MTQIGDVEIAYKELPISDVVEALFQGTDSIRHFVVTIMEPILKGQLNLNDRQTAIVGTYYRIIGWLKAIGELNSLPHYQAVSSGARSLFELLLDIKLIQSDSTGDSVGKFHSFPEVEKYRVARNLVDYCDSTNNKEIECSNQRKFINEHFTESEIKSIVIKHWGTTKAGNPKWPNHWSGLKVADRARKLGPNYEALYIEFYSFLSWHIHSGSTGYAGIKSEGLEIAFGVMHNTIQKVVLDATLICAEVMQIDKIDNLVGDFKSTIENLRDTTNRILIEKYSKLKK